MVPRTWSWLQTPVLPPVRRQRQEDSLSSVIPGRAKKQEEVQFQKWFLRGRLTLLCSSCHDNKDNMKKGWSSSTHMLRTVILDFIYVDSLVLTSEQLVSIKLDLSPLRYGGGVTLQPP